MNRRWKIVTPWFLLLLVAGCARVAFDPENPDNDTTSLSRVLTEIRPLSTAPVNRTGQRLIFAQAKDPERIVAVDVGTGKVLWTQEGTTASRLVVGEKVIAHATGDGHLLGRDITSGKVVWRQLYEKGSLVGLAVGGSRLAYVVTTEQAADGQPRSTLVMLDANSGRELWRRNAAARLGAPVVRDQLVALPFRQHSVAVLSATEGDELVRIRSEDMAVTWVRSVEQGLAFGADLGVYRLDERAASGRWDESTVVTADVPEELKLSYWWDGYNPTLANYTAVDQARLLWDLAPGSDGQFVADRVVALHHRVLFAYRQPAQGNRELEWVYRQTQEDLIGATATSSVVIAVSETGKIVIIDAAQGTRRAQHDVGMHLVGVSFDVGDFAPAAPGSEAKSAVADVLAEIVLDPDRRYESTQRVALEELGRLASKDATRHLVQFVTSANLDEGLREKAGEMLVAGANKESIPLYIDALAARYDFLNNIAPRGVGVLARALSRLKAIEGVPPLLRHFSDHETRMPDLVEVTKALIALESGAALEPFRDFLLTYRCADEFNADPEVVLLVADALAGQGSEEDQQLLQFVVAEPHTIEPLRAHLTREDDE